MSYSGTPIFLGNQIESLRYLGFTTLDAVNELIDNALDADSVFIEIFNEGDNISITIKDDGNGIDGDKIDKALSFEGRIPSLNKNITTGRFGWGLSASACCQSIRTELYSNKSDKWNYTYIDLNELAKQENAIIPSAVPKDPFDSLEFCNIRLKNNHSGTIVYLKSYDNLDFKTINKLDKYLSFNIGEVHRIALNKGKKIFVNNNEVKINDPLMLINGCINNDVLGYGKDFIEIEPIIFDDILDPQTNLPAQIDIKISLLDVLTIRQLSNWKKVTTQYGINIENQGFYLIRNQRQIARAQTLNLFTKHDSLNYFRGQITFPSVLDRYFGIETNKSRCSLSSEIKEIIKDRVSNPLSQLRKYTQTIIDKIKSNEDDAGIRPAEEIVAKAEKDLKKSSYSPSVEEIKKEQENIERQKELEIRNITSNRELDDHSKREAIQKIEDIFNFKRPFKRVLDVSPYGPFYYLQIEGRTTNVVINTDHLFFKEIYERATQNNLDMYLDLLIFTLAKAEQIFYDNEEVRDFYENQRTEWSTILKTYLKEAREG